MRGKTKSCGCQNRLYGNTKRIKDLTNKQFGDWIVLRRSENEHNNAYWLCRCACGITKDVAASSLKQGASVCCTICSAKKRCLASYQRNYKAMVKRAHHRGLCCEISFEEFLEFTKIQTCHYCDEPINWKATRSSAYHLDRKNNSLGYTVNNVVVCCWSCNRRRMASFTYEEFLEVAQLIKKWRNSLALKASAS